MDTLVLNTNDIMLIYSSIGLAYSEISDYVDSEDYDLTNLEDQEFALQQFNNLSDLYKRLAEHLEKLGIPVASSYERDTKRNTPVKDI